MLSQRHGPPLEGTREPVSLSAFSSWFIAQVLKSSYMLVRNRPRTAKEIIIHILSSTGGMPSSHSAVVSSLATAAAFVEGVDSTLFFVTLFYALLTFRMPGVRRAAALSGPGDQSAHPRSFAKSHPQEQAREGDPWPHHLRGLCRRRPRILHSGGILHAVSRAAAVKRARPQQRKQWSTGRPKPPRLEKAPAGPGGAAIAAGKRSLMPSVLPVPCGGASCARCALDTLRAVRHA